MKKSLQSDVFCTGSIVGGVAALTQGLIGILYESTLTGATPHAVGWSNVRSDREEMDNAVQAGGYPCS